MLCFTCSQHTSSNAYKLQIITTNTTIKTKRHSQIPIASPLIIVIFNFCDCTPSASHTHKDFPHHQFQRMKQDNDAKENGPQKKDGKGWLEVFFETHDVIL
jgi:hypothetical protein